ncbi:hypothetical protein CDSM653_02461 [Caldanaerobacter subterraneus subsp. pacificus DSM 12653]|uniref:Uncharacterized protein n=1 Tax=Caldanaerobacter subterraneus subsp. pacificus DSM 12653 TaxID=391606 RepID=A0A0F5PIR3_9THEO|nr:hypothetical protein CDSM653_02461 [Caldanaerobacter subterraneus subsp. pacificus DSM 12653]
MANLLTKYFWDKILKNIWMISKAGNCPKILKNILLYFGGRKNIQGIS